MQQRVSLTDVSWREEDDVGGAVYIINGIKDGNKERLYSDCSVGG